MKIELQVTSIEQSRRLIQRGINPKTASMQWWHYRCCPNEDGQMEGETILDFSHNTIGTGCIPAWTMGDLIDLLPSTLCNVNTREYANLSICKGGVFYDKFDKYGPLVNIRKYDCGSLIECLVDAICELCGKKNK